VIFDIFPVYKANWAVQSHIVKVWISTDRKNIPTCRKLKSAAVSQYGTTLVELWVFGEVVATVE